jgi:mannose/cellobiose epimerase-like protein (N-acyl-D-glucosamine 2-epimerase family)
LITTTPYAYEAFAHAHRIDGREEWNTILRSIAEHIANDFLDMETGPESATCSYTPYDGHGVINASAYRAAVLADASVRFGDDRYWSIGHRNLNFVLENQQSDGSWLYAMDSVRDFVDHYHTCFVLKALTKIEKLIDHEGCRKAIDRGVEYYLGNLFDEEGLPKPYSRAPRLTVYRNELYDCAEAVNIAVLLDGRFPDLDQAADRVVGDILTRWVKQDGSFRSRRLKLGWDNVPMHRWAQSQMFRSLASWQLIRMNRKPQTGGD